MATQVESDYNTIYEAEKYPCWDPGQEDTNYVSNSLHKDKPLSMDEARLVISSKVPKQVTICSRMDVCWEVSLAYTTNIWIAVLLTVVAKIYIRMADKLRLNVYGFILHLLSAIKLNLEHGRYIIHSI